MTTPDDTATRILDAAVLEAAQAGLRKLTMDDVARRASLARMTVYRRYPRRENLVDALVARETQRFLDAVADGIDGADPEDGVAEAFIAAVRFAHAHPMLRRAGQTDSALSTAETAGLLQQGSDFIAQRMLTGSPTADPGLARWVADVFARLFLSYVSCPPTDPDFGDDDQLRRFAHQILTPIAQSAVAPGVRT
jgi:TetR/AcrR family transcriptional regulator, repressor for uid operon